MSGRLENLQKTALKIIYGFSRSYQSLLEISGLETLNQKRKKAVQKFASKTLQNHHFGNVWFEKKIQEASVTLKNTQYVNQSVIA